MRERVKRVQRECGSVRVECEEGKEGGHVR